MVGLAGALASCRAAPVGRPAPAKAYRSASAPRSFATAGPATAPTPWPTYSGQSHVTSSPAPEPAPGPRRPDGVPIPVSNGPRDRPEVALTFDSNLTDAMEAELDDHRVASFDNRAVIDELDALAVPATVFLAGKWMERYPDETRRLAADPLFELASHSYSHRAFHTPCYHLAKLPEAEMAADVARSERLLRAFTDHPTPYFRFPGGCYDEAALRAVAPTGVTVIQYDVASGDAFGRSVGAIVAQVLGSASNGSIVVMHITGGNTAPLTARALPAVVAGLRARGFQLVKLSTLLGTG